MSTLTTTIEIGDTELEVEIEYEAIPGERAVMYTKNGDGYPGSPPYAELIGVKVLGLRDAKEGWELRAEADLKRLVYKTVEDNWKHFGDMCLEDANEQAEAARDAADEEKFERYRNGD